MRKRANGPHSRGRFTRAVTRPPFRDEFGHKKGWLQKIGRAQRHVVRHLALEIIGWPQWSRPLRIAFLSDFHTGAHSEDVSRLIAIIDEAAGSMPDLALFGGDYVNMQLLGGRRVPPRTIAAILSRLKAPLGRFAVLGNHDYIYDEHAAAGALQDHGVIVLEHAHWSVQFQNYPIKIIAIPDARMTRAEAYSLLATLPPDEPTIVLAHDPVWFATYLEARTLR